MAGLKWEIDQLDIDKIETTPIDSSKLHDVVKTEVVKKILYGDLVQKVKTKKN